MNSATHKPWSDFEEDGVAPAASTAENAQPQSTADAPVLSAETLQTPIKLPAKWAMAPVVASILWLSGLALLAPASAPGKYRLQLAAVAFLNLTAIGWLVASRRFSKAAIQKLHRALQLHRIGVRAELNQFEALEPPPNWDHMQMHTSNVENRVQEMIEERQRLTLELSLADTHRRQAEAVFDAMPDPVLVIDAYGQLTMANQAAADLFHFDRRTAQRTPIAELISDQALLSALRGAREADTRAAKRRFEHGIGERHFFVTTSPVGTGAPAGAGADTARSAHGVVAVLRDITKEHEASKMKSDFVARAAHELRTPLSSLQAYAEMLVDGEAADEKTRAEYYDIIQTSATRLSRMIDNMLNVSRIEAGTVRVQMQPVAISMIVKEATDTLRPKAEEGQIKLTEELVPVVDRVMVDRDLIYQALMNLISNAIKYTPAQGEVHVRIVKQTEQNTIRIEVSDSGVGIPPDDLPRLFEKFYRVEANKKVAPGTGLGLHLVKQIVETVHGGEVRVTSEVGKGSVFAITLNLLQNSDAAAERSA